MESEKNNRGRGGGRGGRGGGRGRGRLQGACFTCNEEGHFSRDCPFKVRNDNNYRGNNNNYYQSNQYQSTSSASSSSSSASSSSSSSSSATPSTPSVSQALTESLPSASSPSQFVPRSSNQGRRKEEETSAKYIDTHCHIEYILQKLRIQNLEQLLNRFPSSCEAVVSVYCDPGAFSPSLATWPDHLIYPQIYAAFGCHPHNAKYYDEKLEYKIAEAVVTNEKAVAWGECGLDFHYNHSPPDVQIKVFERQVKKAVELGKPIVVHSREAEEETFKILKACAPPDWPIHMHCFNDSEFSAVRYLKEFSKMYIGITGAVTFNDADSLRSVVQKTIPLDRLLLETDGPYMKPGSKAGRGRGRGRGNDSVCLPSDIPIIAQTIAQLKGVSVDEVLEATRQNAKRMYSIP